MMKNDRNNMLISCDKAYQAMRCAWFLAVMGKPQYLKFSVEKSGQSPGEVYGVLTAGKFTD